MSEPVPQPPSDAVERVIALLDGLLLAIACHNRFFLFFPLKLLLKRKLRHLREDFARAVAEARAAAAAAPPQAEIPAPAPAPPPPEPAVESPRPVPASATTADPAGPRRRPTPAAPDAPAPAAEIIAVTPAETASPEISPDEPVTSDRREPVPAIAIACADVRRHRPDPRLSRKSPPRAALSHAHFVSISKQNPNSHDYFLSTFQ